MGMIGRCSEMVLSHLNAAITKLSNPEKVMRLLIQDMEDTLAKVRVSTVRAIAERKELERRTARTKEEIASWEGKAELAILRDRDDLATAALREKLRASQALQMQESQLASVSTALIQQGSDMEKLRARLVEAKARERTVSTLHKSAKSRLKMRKQMFDTRIDDALMRFERLENSLEDIECEVESFEVGSGRELSQAFGQLSLENVTTSELDELKARVAARSPLILTSA